LQINTQLQSDLNFAAGIASSKFQAGTMPAGVQVSNSNFAANTISISKVAGGNLDSRIKVCYVLYCDR
jgi:hypothetical protein